MLCKFVVAAAVAAFLADQGNQNSDSNSPESKPQKNHRCFNRERPRVRADRKDLSAFVSGPACPSDAN